MNNGMEQDAAAGVFLALAGLGIGVAIFAIIIGLVLYLLMAFGLKKMADNRGIENSWLAFIPIGNMYILGMIVGDIELFGNVIPHNEWVLLAGCLVSFVPIVGQFLAIVFSIYIIVVFYNLVKMYAPGKEVLYTILSVIFAIMGPIFIFMIRDNEAVTTVSPE
ncbi:MAG: hypothetical protein CSB16_02435 [Clostridiales bacterium]|nr:MAG: hypothetical protein CSB16_02435 [Clostridiales bacterium]